VKTQPKKNTPHLSNSQPQNPNQTEKMNKIMLKAQQTKTREHIIRKAEKTTD
jgi:hypothetical protein